LYSSPYIIRVIKSKRRWAGHVAHMGTLRVHTKVWSETPKGRDQLEDLDSNGRIILKWILHKLTEKVWARLI
jgi:hypothetical protein